MRHLDDSLLRRMLDEPLATTAAEREHVDGCARCSERQGVLGAAAQRAASMLTTPDASIDLAGALRATRARFEAEPVRRSLPGLWARLQINPARTLRPVYASGIAVALMGALLVTGAAQQVVDFFAPTQVAPVSINARDVGSLVKGLPDLSRYGTMTITSRPAISIVSSAKEASDSTGLKFLGVGTLPTEVKGTPRFRLLTQGVGSFVFSTEQARLSAVAAGGSLPRLPSNINGTTLEVSAGPALIVTYGEGAALSQAIDSHVGSLSASPDVVATGAPAGEPSSVAGGGGLGALVAGLPNLVVVQMKAPHVSTNGGVSLKELEDAILAMPGVSQQLKDAVHAIGDPASTLPVPVPSGANSQRVEVQGVTGLAIGDSTGIGSVVVWVKGGMVYAVAGTLKEADVLSTARSLH
jgi:hypothetical protein